MTRLSSSILLLISAAIAVSAQQESCANKIQITSEADLSSLASCSTFSGAATVTSQTITAINLPALKSLTGTITVSSNCHLTTLSLDGLQSSTGKITLFNNTVLTTVNLPNLQSISGLEVVTAPNLRQLLIPNVKTLKTLKVEDTGLDNSGNLPWSSLHNVTDLGVSNNKFLKNIDMPALTSVAGHLVIAANGLMEGQGMGSSLLLPNLTSVSNCTLRHLTELQIPSLTEVSSTLSFDETNLETISAPKLKSVGQTLSIVSNNLLNNITFSELTTVGGALLIANNTELLVVDGFAKLKDISGVLNMRGSFNNVSLPSVSTVQGGMSVMSSSNTFDCGTLSKVKAGARGKTQCQAMVKSAKPTNANDKEEGAEGSSAASVRVAGKEIYLAAVAALGALTYIL
ncbi:hypothetical protein BGZ76_000099 [Entomortierella beljakovae]|nr:hypothetical protein BGZ76_000099 [Entomortierella beljakovae]